MQKYKILKEATLGLINVPNKGEITLGSEIYEKLQPCIASWDVLSRLVQTLNLVNYYQRTELDKSYRILKSLRFVDAQSWMLMRTIHDFVLRNFENGPPERITLLTQVLPTQGTSKIRRKPN